MLSTVVSIDGNVLRTRFDSRPFSNGVYALGSNVSVCAIPPAIHKRMNVSAVGSGRFVCGQAAIGAPAASAPMKARRVTKWDFGSSITFTGYIEIRAT